MMKWLGCLGVLVLVVLIMGGIALGSYNSLVGLGQAVDAQWAQVENQYQRRADLIPNLVDTVQGAANFEKSTLEAVVQARASVGSINPAEPAERPGGHGPLPAGAGRAVERAVAPAGRGRALSRAEGEPELPRPAGGSSRARRTGSPSSAAATTSGRRSTTRRACASRRCSSRTCSGCARRRTSSAQAGSERAPVGELQLRRHARAGRAAVAGAAVRAVAARAPRLRPARRGAGAGAVRRSRCRRRRKAHFNDYAGRRAGRRRAAARREAARSSSKQTSTQIVVAVFPQLPSPSLEDFTVRTAEAWQGRRQDSTTTAASCSCS